MDTLNTLRFRLTPHPGSVPAVDGEAGSPVVPHPGVQWFAYVASARLDGQEVGEVWMGFDHGERVWAGPFFQDRLRGAGKATWRKPCIRTVMEACLDWDGTQLGRESNDVKPFTVPVQRCVEVGDDDTGNTLARLGMRELQRDGQGSHWLFEPEDDALDVPTRVVAALSGGGLRAAGFHLGIFSLLAESDIDLEVRIDGTTSVSGGSIFAAAYAVARLRAHTFPEFQERFQAFLDDAPPAYTPTPRPEAGLIGGVADHLAATLFHHDDHTPLTMGDLHPPNRPDVPREVVLQATELYQGRSWLFASHRVEMNGGRAPSSGPRSGTYTAGAWLPAEVAAGVRVADAVAASACFPIGFEPLVFPRDVVLTPEAERALDKVRGGADALFRQGIALVDGGVHDNQGIGALVASLARKGSKADLVLVCDADQGPTSPGYVVPKARAISNSQVVVYLLVASGVLGIVSAILWVGFPLFTIAVLVVAAGVLRAVLADVAGRSLPSAIPVLSLLPLANLPIALWVRAKTAYALLMQTFMNQVRRLNYERLLRSDPTPHIEAVVCLIYDLPKWAQDPGGKGTERAAMARAYPMSDQVRASCESARDMATTLRLTAQHPTAERLIRAGRATACFKLLDWLENTPKVRDPEVRELLKCLQQRWASEFAP